MPHYPLKKLSEICEIEYGTRVVNKRDGGKIYPVYGGGGATFFMDEYNREDRMIIGRFAMSAKCTRSIKGKFFLNDSGLTVSTKNNGMLSQYFLDFYLLSLNDFIYSLGRGTAQKNLNVEKFKDIQIPIPPLSVQEEIVAKLDAALTSIDEAKTKTEQALAATRELWESTLEEAFRGGDGWEEKRLEEVCDRIMDGTHFSPKNSTTGERLYVSAKNIKLHGVDLTKATYISEEDHKIIYKRCPVKKGDVLYIKDGATTGIATINNLDEEFSLLSSVAVFQVTKKLLLEQFLVYYLNSGFGKKHMLGMIDGTAITRLTLTKLNSGIIPLAPLSEQSRIVAHLDAVRAETDRLTSLYEQKLADLDELRRSVLQEAFAQNT